MTSCTVEHGLLDDREGFDGRTGAHLSTSEITKIVSKIDSAVSEQERNSWNSAN